MSSSSPHTQESLKSIIFDLVIVTFFLGFIGSLFVSFSVFLGKFELLILAFVLLLAASIRALLSPQKRERYENLPIIGEGLIIFNHLEAHYLHHTPRSIFYYFLYPITGIWSFFFHSSGRRELGAYFKLIQWMVILLCVESLGSYLRFYGHFESDFAFSWFYLELLCVYFLCNFFTVPLSTTSLKLSLAGKQKRLFISTFLSILILSLLTGLFLSKSVYYSSIPVNLLLDQRMASLEFSPKEPSPQEPSPLSSMEVSIDDVVRLNKEPPQSASLLQTIINYLPSSSPSSIHYFSLFETKTRIFLNHYLPQVVAFNQRTRWSTDPEESDLFFQTLNLAYQDELSSLSIFNEHEHFFITMTGEVDQIWGCIFIPFRDSVLYIFKYEDHTLSLYQRWVDLSSQDQDRLKKSWDIHSFKLSQLKRFSQLLIDYTRKKLNQIKSLNPISSRSAPAENEARTQDFSKAPSKSPVKQSSSSFKQKDIKQTTESKGSKAQASPSQKSLTQRLEALRSALEKTLEKTKKGTQREHLTLYQTYLNQLFKQLVQIQEKEQSWRAWSQKLKQTFEIPSDLNHLKASQPTPSQPVPAHLNPYMSFISGWPPEWIKQNASVKMELLSQMSSLYPQLQSLPSTLRPLQDKIKLLLHPSFSKLSLPRKDFVEMDRVLEKARTLLLTYGQTLSRLQGQEETIEQRANDTLKQRVKRLRYFKVYDSDVKQFDYKRALSMRLIADHFGATPERVQLWWTPIYEMTLLALFWLFELAMPLHILLICYCHWSLSSSRSVKKNA